MKENGKTVAIMQPYIFPYLGYFQLIHAADTFVIYDDVNFIKQGWINRNRVLNNNEPFLFTVPIAGISSFEKICDTEINESLYQRWVHKFRKLLHANYKKAPFFAEASALVNSILQSHYRSIAELNSRCITEISHYLNLKTEIRNAKGSYSNEQLHGKDRVIDICKQEGATKYVNTIAGKDLYSKEEFTQNNIELCFLKPLLRPYPQFKEPFAPGLSIIDVLMFNGKEGTQQHLSSYTFD